jgi:hypothetical protein
MAQIHTLLVCILMGICGVDLCFDSLILFDPTNAPLENFHQIQRYYRRNGDTYIGIVVICMIALVAISLIRCAVFRGWKKDYISLLAFLVLFPYYIFVMIPVGDKCLGRNPSASEVELREGLFKFGMGHVLIITIGTIVCFLDLEWKLEDPKKKLK